MYLGLNTVCIQTVSLVCVEVQVQLAFVAGLAVVVLLIPINRWLAQKIQFSSQSMMASKDARLGILQVMHPHS